MLLTEAYWDTAEIDIFAYELLLARNRARKVDNYPRNASGIFEQMCGETARAASIHSGNIGKLLDEYIDDVSAFERATSGLVDDCRWVDNALEEARIQASQGGLRVDDQAIYPPYILDVDPDTYERQMAVYVKVEEKVAFAYQRAEEAFALFSDSCGGLFAKLLPDGGLAQALKEEVVPEDEAGWTIWWTGRVDDAGSGVQWAYRRATDAELRIPVGVGADGKGGVMYRAPRTVFEKVMHQGNVENWLPGQKPAPTWLGKASNFAAKHADTLKWGARIGGGLAFAVGAYEQWQEDSLNPDLSNGQRVARAGVTGVATAAGGYFGASGGAFVGATMGGFFGPVGALIGGIAGGIVGGALGAYLGESAADAVINSAAPMHG